MKVVCVQLDIAWEDKAANFAKVRSLLDGADVPAGGLVVLPEMFSTGFSMNIPLIAEGEGRPAEAFLRETARAFGAAVLGGVVTPAPDGRGRNEAVLFGPDGRELARYRKMHPFSYAGESDHYEAGDRPVVAEWAGARLAPFVCYDLRFPEVFRSAAARGAEVLVVIANWPEARADHWRTLLRARAVENQAYVVGANRTGADPKAAYAGGSLIVDPRGQVVAEAGGGECALAAELDVAQLRQYRREFPALKDMKPDWVRR
jgi:predicted amidohydrolase